MEPTSHDEKIKKLLNLYAEYVKIGSALTQALIKFPVQLNNEIAAALDHFMSGLKHNTQLQEKTISKVEGHLQRAFLDAVKVFVMETQKNYTKLKEVNLSYIDNGEFQQQVIQLWEKIQKDSIELRNWSFHAAESDEFPSDDLFELAGSIFANCNHFNKNYFGSKKVEWAKQKETENIKKAVETAIQKESENTKKAFWIGVSTSVIGGLVLWGIFKLIENLCTK